jgi:peptidoglycan/LPS O-acetylase OafA/YrhL
MGAGRLFLALVVAADHGRGLILEPNEIVVTQRPQLGVKADYAVFFFYVIIGFLITYTLSANYQRSVQGAALFYRNRVARIFSLYWPLVLVAFIARQNAWKDFISSGRSEQFTGLFLLGARTRLAAVP